MTGRHQSVRSLLLLRLQKHLVDDVVTIKSLDSDDATQWRRRFGLRERQTVPNIGALAPSGVETRRHYFVINQVNREADYVITLRPYSHQYTPGGVRMYVLLNTFLSRKAVTNSPK